MYRRDGRIPEPPLQGQSGDSGITALFLLLVAIAVAVGFSLYLGLGILFTV